MGEQVDDVLGFLYQLAESDFRSALGEFIQVGISRTYAVACGLLSERFYQRRTISISPFRSLGTRPGCPAPRCDD
jgi:hypothetical protein